MHDESRCPIPIPFDKAASRPRSFVSVTSIDRGQKRGGPPPRIRILGIPLAPKRFTLRRRQYGVPY